MALLGETLDALFQAGPSTLLSIPRFDKAIDDRKPHSAWDVVAGAVDFIILEGWCLGATPQTSEELASPKNRLEELEDAQGAWRFHVNEKIKSEFLPLYDRIDRWLMLQAPSFDCVYQWRLEQEQKLADSTAHGYVQGIMDKKALARFIQHYQRLTENCLTVLPDKTDYLYRLGDNREVLSFRSRSPTAR